MPAYDNTLAMDCPEAMLGNLPAPFCVTRYRSPALMDGVTVVNGIVLPQIVIDELRKLGISLSWYNAGELQDAINACSIDSHLVDDADGLNFRDKLTLLAHEHEFFYHHLVDDDNEQNHTALFN